MPAIIITYPRYTITKNGEIRSIKTNKVIKQWIENGYPRVGLWNGEKQIFKNVHKLVAETYLKNPENYPIVNHIDGVKTNNNVTNLEWCSHKHNAIHSVRLGLTTHKTGADAHASKLDLDEVKAIRKFGYILSQPEIGRLFGVSRGCIQAILNGTSWSKL